MTCKSYFLVTAVVLSVVGLAFVEDRPRVGGGRGREHSHGAQLGRHDRDRGARLLRFPRCLAGTLKDGRHGVRRFGNIPIHT